MIEKDFQREFHKWCKYNWHVTSAFELKLCKEKSLPFAEVKPHQVLALYNAKHNRIFYKIPDDSIGQKPFDCFMLEQCQAYIVIMYYELGQKEFVMIDIDDYIRVSAVLTRRSLTRECAYAIGNVYKLGEKLQIRVA